MKLRRFGTFLFYTVPKKGGQYRCVGSVLFCYVRIEEMNHNFASFCFFSVCKRGSGIAAPKNHFFLALIFRKIKAPTMNATSSIATMVFSYMLKPPSQFSFSSGQSRSARQRPLRKCRAGRAKRRDRCRRRFSACHEARCASPFW